MSVLSQVELDPRVVTAGNWFLMAGLGGCPAVCAGLAVYSTVVDRTTQPGAFLLLIAFVHSCLLVLLYGRLRYAPRRTHCVLAGAAGAIGMLPAGWAVSHYQSSIQQWPQLLIAGVQLFGGMNIARAYANTSVMLKTSNTVPE